MTGSDAEREVERFWKQSKRVFKLLRVQEILDEEIAQRWREGRPFRLPWRGAGTGGK